MEELKRCPFCGDRVVVSWFHGSYHVFCTKCGVIVRMPLSCTKEEDCIAAWNNRKPVDDVLERLEKELNSADAEKKRCAGENPFHFDIAKGYATGIYNAIEIIKEKLGGMTDV